MATIEMTYQVFGPLLKQKRSALLSCLSGKSTENIKEADLKKINRGVQKSRNNTFSYDTMGFITRQNKTLRPLTSNYVMDELATMGLGSVCSYIFDDAQYHLVNTPKMSGGILFLKDNKNHFHPIDDDGTATTLKNESPGLLCLHNFRKLPLMIGNSQHDIMSQFKALDTFKTKVFDQLL